MSQVSNLKERNLVPQEVENSPKSIQVKNPTQTETMDDIISSSLLKSIEDYYSGSALSLLGPQFTTLDSAWSTIPKEAYYAEIVLGEMEHKKGQLEQEPAYILCKLRPIETIVDGKKKIERGVTQEYFDSTCVMQFVTAEISSDRAPSISDMIKNIPGAILLGWNSHNNSIYFIIKLTEPIREINKHKTLYRKLMKRYKKLLGVELIDFSDPLKKWHHTYAG